jgi:heptosyltransferase I
VNSHLNIKEICILRLSAIGDVCHAVAAVQAIQKQHPTAKITWVIGKIEAMLLADLPGVEFVIFDKKQGKLAYQQLKQRFKGKQFDVLLHMQVALRANLAAACIPAKVKYGFDWHRAKEGHSLFVNKRIAAQFEPHVLEGFYGFAAKLGVKPQLPAWQMPYQESDLAWAQQQLAGFEKVFVIAPAASKKERNWLAERYAALADYAVSKGYKVVLSGGPTEMERELSTEIIGYSQSDILNLVGKTSLKQLLCVLKCADLVLAPDTGPAHMAVTVGTPVIGLYAHSNPKRTGPYLYQDYVVEVYHHNIQAQFGRPASQLPWGKRCKGADLMAQITTDAVIKMFDTVVAKELNKL